MSKKVWAARELFSRIGAVHREEEFGDAHSSLRGVHTKIGSNRKSVVAPCPVRRRPVAGSSQLSTLNSRGQVHLPVFKQYEEWPVSYALANVFVHASTSEQWGLVETGKVHLAV